MGDATRSNPGRKHGKHPEKALSAAFVRTVTRPGRYCDGQGLYVLVLPSGARCWVQRLVIKGRRRELGLGGYPLVSLAEAREMAFAQRKVARAGGDPLATRRRVHGQLTFEAAAARVLEQQRFGWRNAKHALDWPRSLRAYAFPRIGAVPVSAVTTADVLAILTPIWHTKPATARRVRQRIGAVMKWAVAMGYRPDNPAGDVLGQALSRQLGGPRPAHAGVASRRGSGRHHDRLGIPGVGHHEAGVRVSGVDGGAVRRSALGDVERDGPGRTCVDHPRRADEGEARSPGPALRARHGDTHGRGWKTRGDQPGVPKPAWEAALRQTAEQADQRTRYRRRAAWVPVELPGLGSGAHEYAA